MNNNAPINSDNLPFFKGGGEMGNLTRSYNWYDTSLGDPKLWPQSLKTTISIILNSKFPMFLFWGEDLICFYNDAFRPSLGMEGKHPSMLGKPAIMFWQEIWKDIFPLIEQILSGGETSLIENQILPIYRNGTLEDTYWTYNFSPASDESGQPKGVFVTCIETTKEVIYRKKIELNQQNLENTVRQAPVGMCILKGSPLMLIEANDLFLEIIGKSRSEFEHTPYWEVNKEAALHYKPITDNLMLTGQTYKAEEHEILLIRNGLPETVHVDFVYEPIKDVNGAVDSIVIVAIEVTEKVAIRRLIEATSSELAAMNEEISASNEELINSNEEILASNEKLSAINEELSETQNDLLIALNLKNETENRFRTMIQSSPVAMLLNRGENLIFEEINPAMLELIGKDWSVVGKSILEALPELKGQKIVDSIYHTYYTGESLILTEEPITVIKNKQPYHGFFNLSYNPLFENGRVTGIIQSAIDVTEQVHSRRKIEQAETISRLSIQTANVGTYILNIDTFEFTTSPRLKELFGYLPNEELTYIAALEQITTEYKDSVLKAIADTIKNGINYNIQYCIKDYHDQRERFVNAYGGIYPDEMGKLNQFYGVIIDITEQKKDEQRKNDFIAMVSHELKTPLTSLNAYIQVLQMHAKKNNDAYEISALSKSKNQVNKMTSMINGFLNISRLESGKISIDNQRFDLKDLIKDVEDESLVMVSSHKVVFHPLLTTIVFADREKIGQVINNFISNAVKYSPLASIIQVSCITINGNAQVSVRDEGMGIEPQNIDKLFDRYYRVEGRQMNLISGFGIGLYLCAEIIQRHNGKIWVESEIGNGSTFYFSLPLVDDAK